MSSPFRRDPAPLVTRWRRRTVAKGDSARFVAPPYSRELRGSAAFAHCAIWNSLELPVTMVPMGVGESGMPLGVQVVAGHGNDPLCIAVAQALEESCGGWVVPADL